MRCQGWIEGVEISQVSMSRARLFGFDMLQLFKFEQYLFNQMSPCDLDVLSANARQLMRVCRSA
jgi:hypothetical protein